MTIGGQQFALMSGEDCYPAKYVQIHCTTINDRLASESCVLLYIHIFFFSTGQNVSFTFYYFLVFVCFVFDFTCSLILMSYDFPSVWEFICMFAGSIYHTGFHCGYLVKKTLKWNCNCSQHLGLFHIIFAVTLPNDVNIYCVSSSLNYCRVNCRYTQTTQV